MERKSFLGHPAVQEKSLFTHQFRRFLLINKLQIVNTENVEAGVETAGKLGINHKLEGRGKRGRQGKKVNIKGPGKGGGRMKNGGG